MKKIETIKKKTELLTQSDARFARVACAAGSGALTAGIYGIGLYACEWVGRTVGLPTEFTFFCAVFAITWRKTYVAAREAAADEWDRQIAGLVSLRAVKAALGV